MNIDPNGKTPPRIIITSGSMNLPQNRNKEKGLESNSNSHLSTPPPLRRLMESLQNMKLVAQHTV